MTTDKRIDAWKVGDVYWQASLYIGQDFVDHGFSYCSTEGCALAELETEIAGLSIREQRLAHGHVTKYRVIEVDENDCVSMAASC